MHINLPSKLGDSLCLAYMCSKLGELDVTSGGSVHEMVELYKDWFGLPVNNCNGKLDPAKADIDCNNPDNHEWFWKMYPLVAWKEIPRVVPPDRPYLTFQLEGARAQQRRENMDVVPVPEGYDVYCVGYPGSVVRPGAIPFQGRSLKDLVSLIYYSSCHITVASFTAKLGSQIGTPTIQVHYRWPDENESFLAFLGDYGIDLCGESIAELKFAILKAMNLHPAWKKFPIQRGRGRFSI